MMKKWLMLIIYISIFLFPANTLAQNLPLQNLWNELQLCKGEIKQSQNYFIFQNTNIYGNAWICKKQKLSPLDKLIPILKNNGLSILTKTSEKLEATKKIPEGKIYIRFNNDENQILILKQYIISLNNDTLDINLSSEDKFFFYLDYPKDAYLSLSIEIPKKAEIKVEAEAYFKNKKLVKKVSYNKVLKSEESLRHILYDLPLVAGRQLWSISKYSGSLPLNIKISLCKEGKLSPIPNGDKIGGIFLKNVPYGRAKAIAEKGAEYLHSAITDDNLEGDLTPNGDVVFWLAPGYWKLKIFPFQDEEVSHLETHLIPVFPGYLTEVNWPASIARLFSRDDNVRLEILNFGAKQENGYVNISLLNVKKQKILPKPKDITIYEAGLAGKTLSIERLKTPPEIVILLDSSGSMKKTMKKALQATAKFLQGLPKNSKITLIDFDTQPKTIASGNPQKILKALKKIKANGATALYDAVIQGLTVLEKANRPTLILFTDGKDSNWNDSGPGSRATQKQVFAEVKKHNIPIFTIGFGKKPDTSTLSRLASLSGGAYYSASNTKALAEVFARIQSNLGHQWKICYKRPKQGILSTKPVLALVVDNSGSMETRLEKVRQILHDFIQKLPNNFLVQLFIFSNNVEVKQVLTDNKLALLRAISEMKPLSATNILHSIKCAYVFLHSVPSNNRYLVYITDEALDVEEHERDKLDLFLQKLKDDGVKSLFVGMIDQDKNHVFKKAAKLTGGKAVLAPTPEKLKTALENLASTFQSKEEASHLLRVVFKSRDKFGRSSIYSAATISNLQLPTTSKKTQNPEVVFWKKGEKLRPYGGEINNLITGDDIIGKQVQILKRIPLNIVAKNKAVEIKLKEAVFMSKFRGITPPRGRFLALTLELKNILKPQKVIVYPDGSAHPASWISGGSTKNARIEEKIPDYLIPDAKMHFFLSWNNKTSFPLSDATYLAQTPLILPSENEIYLKPNQPIKGTLIFIVPNDFMEQSALHLYDTAYGHIDLPISGILKIKHQEITKLPKKVKTKLSDTFTLTADALKDTAQLFEYRPEEKNIYRIVELSLQSKVQAHLAINPKKRFFLSINTEYGPFIFKLHPITQRIPLGFYHSRLITPGSYNKLRLVFEIPKALKNNPCSLLVDLKGGNVTLPLKKTNLKAKQPLTTVEGDGINLSINNIYKINAKQIIVDITLKDKPDDSATALSSFIGLKFTQTARARLKKLVSQIESSYIKRKGLGNFGRNIIDIPSGDISYDIKNFLTTVSWETIVLNGQSRRCFVFFTLPEKTKFSDFVLVSKIFKKLNYPLTSPKKFPFSNLLTKVSKYETDDTFTQELATVLAKLTQIRKAQGFVKPGSIKTAATTLDGTKPTGLPISPPSLIQAGGKTWENIKTITDLKKAIKQIKIIPSNWRAWKVVYSPQAVFTQGWCTENEIAFMAEKILSKQGLEVSRLVVALNDKGKQAIKKLYKNQNVDLYELPALAYEDDLGKRHFLIFPWFKEKQELKSFIKNINEYTSSFPSVSIEVIIEAKPLSSSQNQVSAMLTDALAAKNEEHLESITLLSQKISLSSASTDALDLGFAETMNPTSGKVIFAILDTPEGRKIGEEKLELTKYEPKRIRLKIYTPTDTLETIRELKPKQWPTEFFFVIGINMPDLPLSKLKQTNSIWSTAYKKAKNPDTISSLKWLGRGILARFVGAQTTYEQKLTAKLGLKAVRLKTPRILITTFQVLPTSKSKKYLTSLDLLWPYPKLRGPENKQKTFNSLAGFYYSFLEAKALPKGKGINAFVLFSKFPKNTKLIPISPEDMNTFATNLKNTGYPYTVWHHMKNCKNIVLFPNNPLIFGNKAKIAWLEIDPDTYRVWSFLDTGERGATELILGEDIAAINDFLTGFWMGVEVSVWSTASFSLVLDKWSEIKTCAHGFARSLASYLEAATQPKEALTPNTEKIQAGLSGNIPGIAGLSSFSYDCISSQELQKQLQEDAEAQAWTFEEGKEILDSSSTFKELGQNTWDKFKEKYLGFTNGFKKGVDWYFGG